MAAPRRLSWLGARLVDVRAETASARTLVFDTPGWQGHLAGQHVDVRLTAEDGYTAQRSYSIAAPPQDGRVELTVQRVADGEVSGYLVDEMTVGDEIELRGPIGGWFAWKARTDDPVLLVGGGSGVVPLMAMLRERQRIRSNAPFRLVYSLRSPDELFYADELRAYSAGGDAGVRVDLLYTRRAPGADTRGPRRIGAEDLTADGSAACRRPDVFVCGPTGFVEHVAHLLVATGQPASSIRTERFGPTGA